MSFVAVPVACPQISAAIIVLGNTASPAPRFHETLAADPLKAVGDSLSELHEDRRVVPDILQAIRSGMPENELRHRLTDAA